MEENNDLVDYYKILQCERTASTDELKKSYQRLVLSTHPDKLEKTNQEEFLLIQKAWSVLRDPETRKQYDASLSCYEHSDLLLYDTISIKEMVHSPIHNVYTYSCRCGGTYSIEASDSLPHEIVVGCDECSFSILINR